MMIKSRAKAKTDRLVFGTCARPFQMSVCICVRFFKMGRREEGIYYYICPFSPSQNSMHAECSRQETCTQTRQSQD